MNEMKEGEFIHTRNKKNMQMEDNLKLKPFLRWAGSKKQLLPILSTYWKPEHRRYIEPFAGSAALYFKLNPELAILGDINKDLVQTYISLKRNHFEIAQYLEPYINSKEEYYRLRKIRPQSLNEFERAARFIYLNRFCFNGLYRTNLKGIFNVPYGGNKSGQLVSNQRLSQYAFRFKNVKFVIGDFDQTLKLAMKGDFVYMDPPYQVNSTRIFNEYHEKSFSNIDLNRLRKWLEKLTTQNIEFLLSYANSNEGNYLKKDFNFEIVKTKRNIAGFTDNRKEVEEILISNKLFLN